MFEMLAASPVTRAVGLALLHFVWQGLLIAAAAALLLHALRRRSAATRYAVGCVALLAMATAPVITTMRALNEPATASMTTAAVPTIAGVIRADTGSGDRARIERAGGVTGRWTCLCSFKRRGALASRDRSGVGPRRTGAHDQSCRRVDRDQCV